ncbi:Tim10/DDP family zinc finger-domain-containing protein [Radiomyces spectabilis]|uniref:Tim10/DDP family zinc finger-domain-containing protein n=1 Tax=Radiomyces spectabilis TaxID=64574 RepID=UPI00221FC0E5|nr:Tim10/DDP family zinc finger-domain-containing protein [Radiomyces spectabilis]KAI8381354.1 Tim10/DDP family zinc finger-domain-containing protein [Radiomyces spectabilis]
MSYFGANMQQQAVNPQNIAMAEQELEMVTDLFNRIADSCYSKCISKDYETGDLTQGEAVCIDRCVAKFIDVNTKVGEKMQQMGQQPQ